MGATMITTSTIPAISLRRTGGADYNLIAYAVIVDGVTVGSVALTHAGRVPSDASCVQDWADADVVAWCDYADVDYRELLYLVESAAA